MYFCTRLRPILNSFIDLKDMDERLEKILAKYEQEMKSLRDKVEALEKSVETLKRSVDVTPVESIELVHEDFLPDITEIKDDVPEDMPEDTAAQDVSDTSESGTLEQASSEMYEPEDLARESSEMVASGDSETESSVVEESEDLEGTAPVERAESVFASGESITEKMSHAESAQEESEFALDDMPGGDEEFSLFGELIEEPVSKSAERPKAVRTLNDANASKVHKSISDAASAKQAWRNDIPGPEVKDVRSAISLNDRVMFISSLFRDDSMLFQDVVSRINSLNNLDKIVPYLEETFPEWNMESDLVYRFMMAVRRKVR